ncbi:MAG: ArsR family transcriptional regulator [Bacteroidales bacterium]|jgi:predicted DNA-binding transcriptional regulator|nr:ArsR family transcriptional regulator [Bacteroidales bacterium]
MIDSLIRSKTRIKILLKFFLNSKTKGYLRSLEKDFGESTNAIRIELNRFIKAGLLKSELVGNKRVYQANTSHPLYNDLNSIVRKTIGIDKIIDKVTSQIGDLDKAYIGGRFASGLDSDVIELVLIGKNLDTSYIDILTAKAEKIINRKIYYIVLTKEKMKHFYKDQPVLLIWQKDK